MGPTCDACVLGKQKSHSHNNPIRPATRYLGLVHTDLCGPFNPSINGDRYFVTFLDDYIKIYSITVTQIQRRISVSVQEIQSGG
jgi:hypothetical protein